MTRPISLGLTFRMLMRNGTAIWNGRHVVDQTRTAMQEMERYCAAHPNSPVAIRTRDSPFAVGLLSHYWARLLKRVSLALATASRRRYVPLMCNTRPLSGRLLTGISTTATSRLLMLPPFDPRATARSLNVQARRSPCVFERATAQEDSTPLDTPLAQ
jgi:hypothetical protein